MRLPSNDTFERERLVDAALAAVRKELLKAMANHGPMHSAHEAFGVIYEEFMIEFAEEMKENDAAAQGREMIQCAAMCVRALCDVYAKGAIGNGRV